MRWPGAQPTDHRGQLRRQVLHPVRLDVAQRPGQLGASVQRSVEHEQVVLGVGPVRAGLRRDTSTSSARRCGWTAAVSWAGSVAGDPAHRVARRWRRPGPAALRAGGEEARARSGAGHLGAAAAQVAAHHAGGVGRGEPGVQGAVGSSSTQMRASMRRTPSTSSTMPGVRSSGGGLSGRHAPGRHLDVGASSALLSPLGPVSAGSSGGAVGRVPRVHIEPVTACSVTLHRPVPPPSVADSVSGPDLTMLGRAAGVPAHLEPDRDAFGQRRRRG